MCHIRSTATPGLDCLTSGLDCLIYGLDFLISGLDRLIFALSNPMEADMRGAVFVKLKQIGNLEIGPLAAEAHIIMGALMYDVGFGPVICGLWESKASSLHFVIRLVRTHVTHETGAQPTSHIRLDRSPHHPVR